VEVEKNKVSCGKCGVSDVRLYRPYGNFYRPEDSRCNECLDDDHRGWYVPLILSEDGRPWGYLSVPNSACVAFYKLPEKSQTAPFWDYVGGGWSNSSTTISQRKATEAYNSRRKINDKEKAKGRSLNYYQMSPEEQWEEDKKLGILDWDGE